MGVYDFEFSNPKATRVYAVTLRADLLRPFAPQSDEVAIASPDVPKVNPPANATPETPAKKPAEKPQAAPPPKNGEAKTAGATTTEASNEPFRIDLDGIGNRVFALPIPPGNLQTLGAAKGFIYYVSAPVAGLSGPLPGEDLVDPRLRPERTEGSRSRGRRECFRAVVRRQEAALLSSHGRACRRRRRRERCLRNHRRGASAVGSPQSGRRRTQSQRHARRSRSARRVEADVRRNLAPGARLFLRAFHERRRLGEGARQIRPAPTLSWPTATISPTFSAK